MTQTKGHEQTTTALGLRQTVRIDEDKQEVWGDVPADESQLAHKNQT